MSLINILRRCHLVIEGIVSAYMEPSRMVAVRKWAQTGEEVRTLLGWIEEHYQARLHGAD